ncbi:MAG: patatin-like phospholipase family protein [Gemmatimonadetes bacterium]|nr:patatin-like phospholipase family protein [Gemmatimonadota bacterium]
MTTRALMLAGGGVKVAFQAGVLQVWLDEAGLEFDIADGASGGCLNLAMWCQDMSGVEIAENWRTLEPLRGLDIHWLEIARLGYASSVFELDRWRENVFPDWGLDFDDIRDRGRDAVFNVYNFSRHRLETIPAADLTEDYLVASVSLPIWFPPVDIGGETYIDSVFSSDSNLIEAVHRGADELWVIWTVSREGRWRDGFVANYFQIIEAAANSRYAQDRARIEKNNRAIQAGREGEFGRPIEVREIAAEVPVHYLINLGQDRFAEAVNQGVSEARSWCEANDIELSSAASGPGASIVTAPVARLRFTEDMKGYAAQGARDFRDGFEAGRDAGAYLHAHMTIGVDDVHTFVTDPEHEAEISGWIRYEPVGQRLPIESGRFNLFLNRADPSEKRMLYRVFFRDGGGDPLTLLGYKEVRDDPGIDLWSDTSTLYTRILRGHVDGDPDDESIEASGIIRISLPDFMRQLTTFRVEAEGAGERLAAMARFGRLFLGNLWDVYARNVLSSGPF